VRAVAGKSAAENEPKTRARAHPCMVGRHRAIDSSLQKLDTLYITSSTTSTHGHSFGTLGRPNSFAAFTRAAPQI
jgi:hypothetical protein